MLCFTVVFFKESLSGGGQLLNQNHDLRLNLENQPIFAGQNQNLNLNLTQNKNRSLNNYEEHTFYKQTHSAGR